MSYRLNIKKRYVINCFVKMESNFKCTDKKNKDHQLFCFSSRRWVYKKYLDQIRPKQLAKFFLHKSIVNKEYCIVTHFFQRFRVFR